MNQKITSSLFNLSGKTAIITGGGNGIGRASSKMLASFGANVVVSDFNLEAAEQVAQEINDEGGNAIALKCDVTIDQELVDLVDNTLKTFKQIHTLVNNVGGGGGGKENPFEIDVDQFRGVFERNLFSMWRLSQLVAPHMKNAGYGSIINMSSRLV
ncbi:MAG TPA: SDR family NAD(P)-dependent oxidoreductase [Dysgonamonadaceae bacterium]|nr:SDR family NAD(P)-dependent oxidoreductase [Dysgonamonadaceae bacterium]